ncbi:MAG: uroporphyrinogen-III C-methyltransferase [Pseudomonas sp.]
MSEATSDDARPVLDKPLPPPSAKPPAKPPVAASDSGRGLALLALLLAVVAFLLGSWGVWQLRDLHGRESQQLAQLTGLREQTQTLGEREQSLSARLDKLPSAQELVERRRLLVNLQSDQQQVNLRLEKLLGASRQDWRLAEAEHLLRLASLRLSALQDVNSARALVQGAEQILREQDDPGAFAAREQLANSLQALRDVQQPDRTGLFLQLGALREQAGQLSALTPAFTASAPDAQEEAQDGAAPAAAQSRWARWWQQISSFVRIDFNAEQNIRPLLAGQSLLQVRLALSLALEQAQWAVLNGQSEVYQQALAQARTVLAEHFEPNSAASRALDARLAELAKQPVAIVTPNLDASLSAVQAYVQRRRAAAEAADPAASESTATETPESSSATTPDASNASDASDAAMPSESSKAPEAPAAAPSASDASDASGSDGEGSRP